MFLRLVRARIFLLFAILCGGCDRSRPADDSTSTASRQSTAPSAASDKALSAVETVRRIHQYRIAGQIGYIEPYLLPEQRAAVVELMHAVDRLERANEALQAAVRRRLGRASAMMFDRSGVANIVGVFSKSVKVIDERVVGEEALVTIQVAGRVPLEEVHLVRRAGLWLVRTDTPIPGVAAELDRLADRMIDEAARVEDGRLTAPRLERELKAHAEFVARRLAALREPVQP